MTRLLTASDVSSLLDLESALRYLRDAFASYDAAEIAGQRAVTPLPQVGPGRNSATALLPGLLPAIPAYTVKVNAKFPASTPALRGVVCLHALHSGELLALMDSASLTAWRTGLAAALATDALAPREAATVAFVGAGAQAAVVLAGLLRLRRIDHVVVCDIDPGRAETFRGRHVPRGLPATIVPQAADAAAQAEIVVTATWARHPVLDHRDLHGGQHLTILGADEPGKQEVGAELLRRSWVVVDDPDLAARSGAVGNAGLQRSVINATAGEVFTGRATRPGPTVTSVYAPVGLPYQDLALAWPIFQAAENAGAGLEIDFLA